MAKLTKKQEQALAALVDLVPDTRTAPPAADQPAPTGAKITGLPTPDMLQAFLGVSREDVAGFVAGLLSQKTQLEGRLLDWVEKSPLDAIFEFIAAASLAFYAAEKDANPKVKTYTDAFYYIATSASVGYADIFAVTQTGRAIASLVMLVGPALATRSLDRPKEKVSQAAD